MKRFHDSKSGEDEELKDLHGETETPETEESAEAVKETSDQQAGDAADEAEEKPEERSAEDTALTSGADEDADDDFDDFDDVDDEDDGDDASRQRRKKSGKKSRKGHQTADKKKKKHRMLLPIIIVIVVILLALAAAAGYYVYDHYVYFQKQLVDRSVTELAVPEGDLPTEQMLSRMPNLTVLDLSGRTDVTVEQAESLKAALLNGCTLLWNVPLTDGYFRSDSTTLTLPGCTAEDVALFSCFENLASVDATGSTAYEALYGAAQNGLAVTYTAAIGDAVLTNSDTALKAAGVSSVDELTAVLPYFDKLTDIDLRGGTVADADMRALREEHPEITFHWTVHIGANAYDSDAEEIDLTGVTFASKEEAIEALSSFEHLTSIDLRGTGLFGDDAVAVIASLGDIPALYDVTLYGTTYSCDITELDLSALQPADVNVEELTNALPHFKSLTAVLFPTGMDADAVAPLSEAYPNILFEREITVFGQTVMNTTKEMDISNIALTLDEAMAGVAELPYLEKLIMCDCGLENSDMDQLLAAYPNVKFVWNVAIGPHTVRTDAIAFSTKNPSKYTNANASEAYNKSVKSTVRLYEGDIENLKYCTDLVALDLGHNYLTNNDLKVIAGLTNLQILILADNKITDISALVTLQKLEYIELFMNSIPDMSPLAQIQTLTDVNVANTQLKDLTPFYSLPNLKRLWYAMNSTVSKSKCKELAEYLKTNYGTTCDYTTWGETDGGWREGDRYTWMHGYFYN